MKKSFIIIITVFVLYGCELIDISRRQTIKHINLTQDTPIGTVYLFMAEIDSSNAKGASVLLAQENGKLLLANDKFEKYEEMQRLKRILRFFPITLVKYDTLSPDKMKVKMEVDYYKQYSFITQKINNSWYITHFNMSN